MNINPRLMFFVVCILVRSALAYAAYRINTWEYFPYISLLALLPIIGWLYIYFISPRTVGPETFGAPIWWNSLRPIHAMLYGLFIIMAFKDPARSYWPLVADVGLAIVAQTVHSIA